MSLPSNLSESDQKVLHHLYIKCKESTPGYCCDASTTYSTISSASSTPPLTDSEEVPSTTPACAAYNQFFKECSKSDTVNWHQYSLRGTNWSVIKNGSQAPGPSQASTMKEGNSYSMNGTKFKESSGTKKDDCVGSEWFAARVLEKLDGVFKVPLPRCG